MTDFCKIPVRFVFTNAPRFDRYQARSINVYAEFVARPNRADAQYFCRIKKNRKKKNGRNICVFGITRGERTKLIFNLKFPILFFVFFFL